MTFLLKCTVLQKLNNFSFYKTTENIFLWKLFFNFFFRKEMRIY